MHARPGPCPQPGVLLLPMRGLTATVEREDEQAVVSQTVIPVKPTEYSRRALFVWGPARRATVRAHDGRAGCRPSGGAMTSSSSTFTALLALVLFGCGGRGGVPEDMPVGNSRRAGQRIGARCIRRHGVPRILARQSGERHWWTGSSCPIGNPLGVSSRERCASSPTTSGHRARVRRRRARPSPRSAGERRRATAWAAISPGRCRARKTTGRPNCYAFLGTPRAGLEALPCQAGSGETCTQTGEGPCYSDVLLVCSEENGQGVFRVQSFPCHKAGPACGFGSSGPQGDCSESCSCLDGSMVCTGNCPDAGLRSP